MSGKAEIDTSLLTGEAALSAVSPGDRTTAGTVAVSGQALVVEATAAGQDTTLQHIMQAVGQAQARKAPIQRLADTVAEKFTCAVLTVSLATCLLWGTLGALNLLSAPLRASLSPAGAWLMGLRMAVNVIVVACPCALGLATPTALLVGTGAAAQNGILFRGGDTLEMGKSINTCVLDKTGTVTMGKPTVKSVELMPESTWTEKEVLALAGAVQSSSLHPVGKALAKASQELEAGLEASSVVQVPGMGAAGNVHVKGISVAVCAGTWQWLGRNGVAGRYSRGEEGWGESNSTEAVTEVLVSADRELVGAIALVDKVRPEAASMVLALREAGLQVMLLSGDKASTATQVAEQIGLTGPGQVVPEMSPAGKAAHIAGLQAAGNVVAMVGDGINDGPALATADLGIVVRSSTDVAVEASGVVLTNQSISNLPLVFHIARETMATARANVAWALCYNAVALPLAAGALMPWGLSLTPSIAGAMMSASSILVVLNALRLRGKLQRGKEVPS
ncbi:unnamed protein product [Chrysoparadoxa australica]